MPGGRPRGAGLGWVTAVLCAAVVVLTACGTVIKPYLGATNRGEPAGSPATPAGTATGGGPGGRGFATVIPPGFTDRTAAANGGAFNFAYFVLGPQRTSINVVRGSSGGLTDMDVVVRLELQTVKRIFTSAHQFSSVGSLMIDGAPARAVDFLNSLAGRPLHQRQIYVVHGGHLYVITFTAAPSLFASETSSLDHVLAAWRWS